MTTHPTLPPMSCAERRRAIANGFSMIAVTCAAWTSSASSRADEGHGPCPGAQRRRGAEPRCAGLQRAARDDDAVAARVFVRVERQASAATRGAGRWRRPSARFRSSTAAGMPMSASTTSPQSSRPGSSRWPGFLRKKVTVRSALDRRAAHRRRWRRRCREGTSIATTGTSLWLACVDQRRPSRRSTSRSRPAPSSASTIRPAPAEYRRSPSRPSAPALTAASPLSLARSPTSARARPSRLAQLPRHHEPVAAIVARAAQHQHGPLAVAARGFRASPPCPHFPSASAMACPRPRRAGRRGTFRRG